MLRGRCVVLGVSGSIAAYKIASLASLLVKQHADVHVIMTKNACNFINPITFETLTGNKCLVDTFDRNFEFSVEHVSLAKKADIFVVAPASADVIAKLAHGIADDMLTTTCLASICPKYIFPAMNTQMYLNPITQDNISKCLHYKMNVIDPASGYLACGDFGEGKMLEPEAIMEVIMMQIAFEKDLKGKRVLVTAGPTREAIDPVRFITNHSTGKMGYELTKAAARRGAEVTLVSGPTALKAPFGVKLVSVETAAEMFDAVSKISAEQDVIIKAAAVADYRPTETAEHKVKKSDGEMVIALERTDDILGWLGEHRRDGQFLCGFSMETENLVANSQAKLEKKHADMIVANNLKDEGAGFGVDTNVITMFTKDHITPVEILSKEEVAHIILNEIRIRL